MCFCRNQLSSQHNLFVLVPFLACKLNAGKQKNESIEVWQLEETNWSFKKRNHSSLTAVSFFCRSCGRCGFISWADRTADISSKIFVFSQWTWKTVSHCSLETLIANWNRQQRVEDIGQTQGPPENAPRPKKKSFYHTLQLQLLKFLLVQHYKAYIQHFQLLL